MPDDLIKLPENGSKEAEREPIATIVCKCYVDGLIEVDLALPDGGAQVAYSMLGVAQEHVLRYAFRKQPLEGQSKLWRGRHG